MRIGNNVDTVNTQTRRNIQKLLLYIDPVGDRTRDLRNDDTIKIYGSKRDTCP